MRFVVVVVSLAFLAACDRSDRCDNVVCDVGETCADLAAGAVCICDADRSPGPDGGCLVPDGGP